ncbi:BlaI/MecI/CopY family transcriptional regulator [Anaerosporobacter sp.]|uniref:BlaI/MecI/CopY family transcriptional regulator n=1 Tax=Anaerosporobacter sp. TaxID=1872529 RepID=UPI00286F0146|nr:BlaI/MecI/CopY family transcriptional regulator [Anaerosporobacter sp.]
MSTYSLSDAELLIMRIIWNNGGELLFADLMKELNEMEKSWKVNTVLTFLSRLIEKEVLKVEKQGRLNRYIALRTESEYTESLTQSFLGKFFDGNAKNLVASLLQQNSLTSEDIAELQEFWKGKGEDIG